MRQLVAQLGQDLRYAARSLARDKAFFLAALFTLALGVGGATAIFSVVNGLILRPLPFAQPDRLVQLYPSDLLPRGDAVSNLAEFRSQSASFDSLAGYEVGARYLRDNSGAERVMTVQAERSFFSMLGAPPLLGRTFRPDDAATVVVVGEPFWRRRLGGDPSAVGRTITLDDVSYTVIGVMPEAFQFPYRAASILSGVASETRTDLWIPLARTIQPRARVGHVTGRLKQNVSLSAAESELKVIARRLELEYPESNSGRSVRLAPLSEVVVAPSVRRPLFLLFGAMGLVLLLACANVANLSLARTALRRREFAIRSAIGAGRLRLARQSLTESLAVSLSGGLIGLVLAWWATGRVMALAASQIPRAHEVNPDWRVFLFLLAVCTVAGLAVGLAPALLAARKDSQSALRESDVHATTHPGQRRLRDALVIAEVAIGFVLAVGAAALIRELVRLRNADTGMVTRNVMTFHLGRPFSSDVTRFYEISDRVSRLPGVRAAGCTQVLPLQNWNWTSNSNDFFVRGRQPLPTAFPIELRFVTPGYFRALGIPIKRGRPFTSADDRWAPRAILINETLARLYFGDEDPVGKQANRGMIVGVVGDVRQVNLDRPAAPELYTPAAQNWSQVSDLGVTLVVSAEGRPENIIEAVRAVVGDVDRSLAIFNIKTMDRVLADALADLTLFLWLMTSFAVTALALALTGTYGVISRAVTSRGREFAIRMAVGASAAHVWGLVFRHAIRLVAIGLGLGLFAVFVATPLLRGLPMRIAPPGVAITAPIALLVAIAAVVACLAPAIRAARANPIEALRND